MPMRSCEPTVVRWRSMASMARVMAVEKPMQYSVLRTSLSIVFGTAMTFMPCWSSVGGVAERIVAADGDQVIEAQRLDILQHLRT